MVLYRVVIEQILLMQMFFSVKIRFKMPSKIWCESSDDY